MGNPNEVSTTFQRVELSAAWKLNEQFTLRGALPWNHAEFKEGGSRVNSFSGLGDASLSLLWSPWGADKNLSGLAVTLGLILPTGEATDQPLTGLAAPTVFQAGTGTVQGLVGVRYSRAVQDWSFGVSAGTSFAFYESEQDFRPASTYRAEIFAGRAFGESWQAKLAVEYFHGTRDEFMSQEIANTGSSLVSLKPTLILNVTEELAASASVSIPVWRSVNRTQIAVGPLWSAGLSYYF